MTGTGIANMKLDCLGRKRQKMKLGKACRASRRWLGSLGSLLFPTVAFTGVVSHLAVSSLKGPQNGPCSIERGTSELILAGGRKTKLPLLATGCSIFFQRFFHRHEKGTPSVFSVALNFVSLFSQIRRSKGGVSCSC